MKTRWIIAAGVGLGLSASCLETSTRLASGHCNTHDGNAWCMEKHVDGSRPYCRLGTEDFCNEGLPKDHDGCVEMRPEQDRCYSACGGGVSVVDDPDCEGVADTGGTSSGLSSTGTTPDTTSTSGEDTLSVQTDGTETNATSSGTEEGGGCDTDTDCDSADAPFCNEADSCVSCDGMPDGNAACTEQDATSPVCNEGVCVQCTTAESDTCDGQTPVCNDAENACQACTEHFECPDSACHLDGADVGACFDQADVVDAANEAALRAAVTGAAGAGQVVVRLTGANYALAQLLEVTDDEVAILGTGSQVISRNGDPVVTISSSGIVYFSEVAVANGSGNGVNCSGTSVWLDDSEVRNNAQVGLDISGGCAAHLRRTVVAVNNGGGVDVAGGELTMQNSAIGLNGNDLASTIGGVRVDATTLDIRYSAIVGNEATNPARASISCGGGELGEIRNSILVAGGNSLDGCNAVTFENNGIDETMVAGDNANVGPVMAGWFMNLGANDFHLTGSGEGVFVDIAQWQDGDPLTDIDGDAIETEMASFPGYDQP